MTRQFKLISICIVVLVVAALFAFFYVRNAPSKEVMSLEDYFGISSDEMAIILQDTISEETGRYVNGTPYISYGMVKELMNKRFYWDKSENILVYTTPTEVIKVSIDSKEYNVNKSTASVDYEIVKMFDNSPYIAVPFVKQYSNIEFVAYELPNRIVINYKWGVNQLKTTAKKKTELRYEDSVKSPKIADIAADDPLIVIGSDEEIKKDFSKVITNDGIIGYIKNSKINESTYETLESSYSPPQYSHIRKDYDICMVWNQVTNADANGNMLDLINKTKGVNTISPTWFTIKDNNGNINSLADERYVERAHEGGIEVWGLCSDITTEEIDMKTILSTMTSREKLENKLISLAIEYDLDGINIDFESIKADSGEDFIEFIRELSTKCRNNGIILSIDNYIPASYREYYDYEEQGEVADYVVIMAYDEHYAGGDEAGSVSSIGYVKNAVSSIIQKVPADQVIMGLPFYTRLWEIKNEGTDSRTIDSTTYGMSGAITLLNEKKLTPSWDDETGQYYAEYDENGATYKIWIEEETSTEETLKACKEGGINNVAFWRLGFENAQVWNVIMNYINAN